ncbi:hypothetical protein [Curtobacterium flaccumfaciens]|uniref:hypothetical protein n=1 Tax=Curtobacterium flaccumfaciens TaxID=2035 RepID=UPI001BDE6944|nr:hypothetical protein [Curtobacterium flaccumfaciens]MBT1673411.1 hypothetical protein [Curtobacterium flaccumfaciens pv. flaccumfaciens]
MNETPVSASDGNGLERRRERQADNVEDITTVGLQALASAIPVLGPFLAAGVQVAAGSAQMRRLRRDVDEVRADLNAAISDGRIQDVDEVVQSESFLADLQFVLQRSAETKNAQRRARLRRALVAGAAAETVNSETDLRVLDRLSETHVKLLRVLHDDTTKRNPHGQVALSTAAARFSGQRYGHAYEPQVRALTAELSALGLVFVDQQPELDSDELGDDGGIANREVTIYEWYKLTRLAKRVINYIADEDAPLESGNGSSAGDRPPAASTG